MSFINIVNIHPQVKSVIDDFTLPESLGFCTIWAPIMIQCDYANGEWGEVNLKPYGMLQLDPAAKALHYGHQVFEGMKAYNNADNPPVLFRPEQNWLRFNRSATKLRMPEVPEDIFMGGVEALTAYCAPIIPSKEAQSLYLRPYMIATQPVLGLDPSTTFSFIVLASPSEGIFSSDVHVLIERQDARAAKGGTGCVKAGGNYAAALGSAAKASSLNCNQTLWLDSQERMYIEELSGMNFFAVIDGELYTPSLTDTILPGITRDSVIKIAPELGYRVHETRLNINELLEQIKQQQCTEAFACGTAAVITPIKTLAEESGENYPLSFEQGPITMALRQHLMGIQSQTVSPPEGWIVTVPAV